MKDSAALSEVSFVLQHGVGGILLLWRYCSLYEHVHDLVGFTREWHKCPGLLLVAFAFHRTFFTKIALDKHIQTAKGIEVK